MKQGFTARSCVRFFTSRYLRFCLVGLSGLVVDSILLLMLTTQADWPVVPSKLLAAEVAVANNFFWNNLWTFTPESDPRSASKLEYRFLRFNVVSLTGILLSTVLVLAFRNRFGFPILPANGAAVVLVSLWNFRFSKFWVWERNSSQHTSNNHQPDTTTV